MLLSVKACRPDATLCCALCLSSEICVQGTVKPTAALAVPQADGEVYAMDVDPPKEAAEGPSDEAAPSNAIAEQASAAPEAEAAAVPAADGSAAAAKVTP